MSKDAITQLNSIIAKYRRMPVQPFLLNEAYIDKGYDKNGYPAGQLIFEIKPVNDEDLAANLIDQELPKTGHPIAGSLRIISLSSTLNPEKKYTLMNGEQIALRARQLKSFLELRLIQPPGSTVTNQPHLALDIESYRAEDPGIKVTDRVDYRCTGDTLLLPDKAGEYRIKETLNGLRKGSSSQMRIKILQDMLFNMGYGEEMHFEHYKLDGRYGKRTSLAVAAFKRENNYIHKKKSKTVNGERIHPGVNLQLIAKCKSGWRRFNYKVFLGAGWKLKKRNVDNEMTRLRWRYHTAQLQHDLLALTIATDNGLQYADDPSTSIGILSTEWEWGKYDQFTEDAVKRFQNAALHGCRYDPVNQIIVYSFATPTYHGSINGVLDDETRIELIRWFDDMEQLVNFENVAVSDSMDPVVDLREAVIEAPMLGCCNLVFAGGVTDLLISTPSSIEGNPVTAEVLKQNLPYCLFLHRPVDDSHPFIYDNHRSSYRYDYHYLVGKIEPVTDSANYRFYTGTANEQKPEDHTAQYIDSGEVTYRTPRGWVTEPAERGLNQDLQGNTLESYDPALNKKYRNIYDRKYPGFFEKLEQEERKLWEVRLELTDSVTPGIYLFKINHGADRKPHPIKVVESGKEIFNILHLTDIHVAARHEEIASYLSEIDSYNNPNENFRNVLHMINSGEIEADFIIITGDLVDCANNYRPYDIVNNKHIFAPAFDMDANWRLLHYYITTDPGSSVPVYMCLGNHDYRPNPASVSHYKNDFNITEEQAELYPFDTRDQSFFDDPLGKWILHRCFSDSLYADKNAAQYYFENICPFSDYKFDIGDLNFLFMDTGVDKNIFVSTYGFIDGIEKLYPLIIGHLPAPKSIGFTDKQIQWLQRAMVDGDRFSNILCMHSPVIKPPLNEMVPRFDSPSFMENDITESVEDHDESCLIGGRNMLLDLMGQGQLRLVLTGHTHLNVEIRCDPDKTPAGYFVANYSQNDANLSYFNEQGNNLLLTTTSGGVLGCDIKVELDDWLDSFTKNDVVKYFSHCGYRNISIGVDGKFKGFSDEGLWDRYGSRSVTKDDDQVRAHDIQRELFQAKVDDEVMPRVKKAFAIENREQSENLAVDDKYCAEASIRAYIYLKSRTNLIEVSFCITPLHVSLLFKDLLFDPTYFDLYRVPTEPMKPDRTNPDEESHIKYQSIVGEIIAFTNGEAQAGMVASRKEMLTYFYKKRPQPGSYINSSSQQWSSSVPGGDFENHIQKRKFDEEIAASLFERAFGDLELLVGPDHQEYESQFGIDGGPPYVQEMKKVWIQWEQYEVLKNNSEPIPNNLLHMKALDANFTLSEIINL